MTLERFWLEQLSDRDKDLWNEWVSFHSDAHFYHLWEWGEALSATYNYQRFYFAVKSNEGIVGVFPIVLIRSRIFKSKLVSLPFCEYGGPLLNDSLDSSAIDAIVKLFLKAGSELIRKIKADYLEIRQPSLSTHFSTAGFFPLERYLTFHIGLVGGEAEVWRSMDKKCRNAIKKAEKSGVKVKNVNKEHVKHYYNLYLDTEKRHGSPPHSEKLFTNILEVFHKKGLAQMFLAVHDGRPIGGIIVFCFNGKMYWWNNVTDRKYSGLNPTNILLWNAIQWGCENNLKTFDLGRTRSETKGIYHFKSSWGGQCVSLKDYVLATKEVKLSDPLQERYLILSKIWSKLPSRLVEHVGPRLVSGIGL